MLLNIPISLLVMASTTTTTTTTTSIISNRTTSLPQIVNSSFVIHIVNLLQQHTEYKNFVFYISKDLLQHESDVPWFMLQQFSYQFPMIPFVIILDNSNSMIELLDKSTLCLIMTTKLSDPIMNVSRFSLIKQRYFDTIFLLYPLQGVANEQEIQEFFEWVWDRRFLYSLLITVHNQVYLYEPYPFGNLINKTDNWQVQDFFKRIKLNLKGWRIDTPIYFDLPRVFWLKRPMLNDTKLSGVAGKFFEAFVQYINGTFNETFTKAEPFKLYEMLKLIEDVDIEISVHSYTARTDYFVDNSYPVGINDWCFVVPFHRDPAYMFLQKILKPNGWLLLGFAVIYITLGIWLCTPAMQRDLSLAFLHAICALLMISPQRLLMLPIARARFLFIILFVLGFCLTNLYLSKMATYLTASTDEHQINSIQDMIKANLKIMLLSTDYNFLANINFTKDIFQLILNASVDELVQHRDSLNISFGYMISSDRWHFLNKQQELLKKPLMRLTSICVGPFYHAFPMAENSDLRQPFTDYIMAVQQAGLIKYWENVAFYDALFMGYIQLFKSELEFTSLSFEFLRSILLVWCCGLILSTFAFIFELRQVAMAKLHKVTKKK